MLFGCSVTLLLFLDADSHPRQNGFAEDYFFPILLKERFNCPGVLAKDYFFINCFVQLCTFLEETVPLELDIRYLAVDPFCYVQILAANLKTLQKP